MYELVSRVLSAKSTFIVEWKSLEESTHTCRYMPGARTNSIFEGHPWSSPQNQAFSNQNKGQLGSRYICITLFILYICLDVLLPSSWKFVQTTQVSPHKTVSTPRPCTQARLVYVRLGIQNFVIFKAMRCCLNIFFVHAYEHE